MRMKLKYIIIPKLILLLSKEFIKSNFDENKFLIGINISAGSEARFWGNENYKLLIEFLISQDVNLLILTDPKDLNLAKVISGQ